ncbi:hypothetical protein AXG93_3810s1040 [Marchantia polymorpha subsp. ruderalis]|uniref:Uncharacterized protein n=1 Tax=Marchantia polymorpha subsp. ruderalis TaxID=1480154 RepID=A0A176VFD2_MARPO|nr:hypothetical protein AXG93_3810s1040 [Marchantia polymorpha subsp. ruderalis]
MASPVFAKGLLLVLLVVISSMNEEVEASARFGLRSSGTVTGSNSVHPDDQSQKVRPFEALESPAKLVRDPPDDSVAPPSNIARVITKSVLNLFDSFVPQVSSNSGTVTGSNSVHPDDQSQKVRPFEALESPAKLVREPPGDSVPPSSNISPVITKSVLKLFDSDVAQVSSKQENCNLGNVGVDF